MIVTNPYSVGDEMGGIGLRMLEVAQVLKEKFDVQILCSSEEDDTYCDVLLRSWKRNDWRELINASDAIVFTDLPDPRMLVWADRLGKQIVSENAVPIEHLDFPKLTAASNGQALYDSYLRGFGLQCLVTDFFLVRSSVERAGILAALALAGRLSIAEHSCDRNLSKMLKLVPIGFNQSSEALADRQREEPVVGHLLWSGGIWDYNDPGVVVHSVAEVIGGGIPVSLEFMYPTPRDQQLKEAAHLKTLIAGSSLQGRVSIAEVGPRNSERDRIISRCRALVCIGRDGIENYTCHRLRLRDVFLHRKPIIVDGYGATGDMVERLGIGLVVRSPRELSQAISDLVRDDAMYQSLVSNIDRCRDEHRLEAHLAPLKEFIQGGARALDRSSATMKLRVARLLADWPEAEEPPIYPY